LLELPTHQRSKVHSVDARVKVTITLAWLVCINLLPGSAWLIFFVHQAAIIPILLISRISPSFVAKRVLVALPFTITALPLIFTGTDPHLPVLNYFGTQLLYSPEGAFRFFGILLKSGLSIQVAVILAATTRFPDILFALRELKFPSLLVTIIGFMWRYLFLIREEANQLMRARSSRTSVIANSRYGGGTVFWRAGVAGGMAANLLLRSLERSDRVFQAMVSRGYNGELPPQPSIPLSKCDRTVLVSGIIILLILNMPGWLAGV